MTRQLRRRLARAIAAALCFTVALLGAGTTPATAHFDATHYGQTATWKAGSILFGLEATLAQYGYWLSCEGAGYWTTVTSTSGTGTQILHVAGACRHGLAMLSEHDILYVDPAGDQCGRMSSPYDLNLLNEDTWDFSFGPFNVTTDLSKNCGAVTELCFAGDSDFCVPFAVGAPPAFHTETPDGPDGPCPYGVWKRPTLTQAIYDTGVSTTHTHNGTPNTLEYQHQDYIAVKMHFDQGATAWPANYKFRPYVLVQGSIPTPASGLGGFGSRFGNLTSSTTGNVYVVFGGNYSTNTTSNIEMRVPVSTTYFDNHPVAASGKIVGAGVSWDDASNFGGSFPTSTTVPTTMPVGWNGADFGINDINRCTRYWGEKAVNLAGTTADDPSSVLPDPVVPPSYDDTIPPTVYVGDPSECPAGTSVCVDPMPDDDPTTPEDESDVSDPDEEDSCGGFSLADPSSWGGATVCVLIKMLGVLTKGIVKIVSAIAGLVADLLEGIAALFIPDPTSWGVDALIDQLQARAPFTWITGVADSVTATGAEFAAAGSDQCAAFAGFGPDVAAACPSDPVFPSWARTGVSALLMVLTSIYVFHIVAEAVKD